MHQDSWLHPSLADGWSAWASDAAPAAQPAPRSRVALGAAAPISAAFNGSQSLARVGRTLPRAVSLGGTNADVWGDAARQSATASVTRAALAAGQAQATPSTCSAAARPQAPVAAEPAVVRVTKPASDRPHSAGPRARPRIFEFIGHGALSVTSSITGKHYRFTEHGAQLSVDPRDWSQLSRVPSLRAIVV